MKSFQIFSNPTVLYRKMLEDIKNAKTCIYLETYIYDSDYIGDKFRKALIKKAEEGLKIAVLVDAWGSTANREYFEPLVNAGAKVKFFREFQYVIRIFSKNHERNHRKLLLIDDEISYVGSANITASCIDWRELTLRLEGSITEHFVTSFIDSWKSSGKITKTKIREMVHKGFEIINDKPSTVLRETERKYVKLLNNAKDKIMIETPYFIPSRRIREALARAVKRGVNVEVIIPQISDVRIVDMVRNRYLGDLYNQGININYYSEKILHSKLLIVDNSFFILGSSNLDYRSLIHQYEVNLMGRDKNIIKSLKNYFNNDLISCKPFNYNEWKQRSSIKRIYEMILYSVRKFL